MDASDAARPPRQPHIQDRPSCSWQRGVPEYGPRRYRLLCRYCRTISGAEWHSVCEIVREAAVAVIVDTMVQMTRGTGNLKRRFVEVWLVNHSPRLLGK